MFISIITNTRTGLNIGSRNQVLGVAEAIKRIHSATGEDVIIHEYDINDLPRLAHVLNHNSEGRPSHIVIGVGDDGVRAFEQLPAPLRHTSVLIGHEVPKGIEKIQDKISMLAIPEHITNYQELDGVNCIRTRGVAHAMTAEKASEAFRQWKPHYSKEAGQPIIAVMLGGAVDGKNYSPEEAKRLGEYVVAKAKAMGAYVLATGSPRAQPTAIFAFNEVLFKNGCEGAYFPFMKDKNESPFHALIGAVASDPKNLIFVTGDSVSMACEGGSLVQPSQLFLYPVSNENSQNKEFVEWMYRNGKAGVVEYSGAKSAYSERPLLAHAAGKLLPLDASEQIAAEVYALISANKSEDTLIEPANTQSKTYAISWRSAKWGLASAALMAGGIAAFMAIAALTATLATVGLIALGSLALGTGLYAGHKAYRALEVRPAEFAGFTPQNLSRSFDGVIKQQHPSQEWKMAANQGVSAAWQKRILAAQEAASRNPGRTA